MNSRQYGGQDHGRLQEQKETSTEKLEVQTGDQKTEVTSTDISQTATMIKHKTHNMEDQEEKRKMETRKQKKRNCPLCQVGLDCITAR